MRAGAWGLHPVWVPGCKCPVQSLNPLHCSSWKDEIVIITSFFLYWLTFWSHSTALKIVNQIFKKKVNDLWSVQERATYVKQMTSPNLEQRTLTLWKIFGSTTAPAFRIFNQSIWLWLVESSESRCFSAPEKLKYLLRLSTLEYLLSNNRTVWNKRAGHVFFLK